jgi:hypothetical protein
MADPGAVSTLVLLALAGVMTGAIGACVSLGARGAAMSRPKLRASVVVMLAIAWLGTVSWLSHVGWVARWDALPPGLAVLLVAGVVTAVWLVRSRTGLAICRGLPLWLPVGL